MDIPVAAAATAGNGHGLPPLNTSGMSSSYDERVSDAVHTQLISAAASAVADEMVEVEVSRVLIIYTGGTIGMRNTPDHGYLPVPNYLTHMLSTMSRFHDPEAASHELASAASLARRSSITSVKSVERLVNNIRMPEFDDGGTSPSISGRTSRASTASEHRQLPPLQEIRALMTPPSMWGKRIKYSVLEFNPLLDSSNMTMIDWTNIAISIEDNYELYDAFIILHGTDTMAYTASALSFMLEDLGKTVIITGSQVPLAEVRNDAVENLLGALTIAGHFVIPEVTLYFSNKLYRGNRTSKMDAVDFQAFDSPNLRPLVSVGINIDVAWDELWRPNSLAKFKAHKIMTSNVATLRLFPGIMESTVRAFLQPPIQGVVLETYGAGNAPNNRQDLLNALREASDRGVVICKRGLVSDLYSTGKALLAVGIVPGSDMTPECALTKLSYLLGKGYSPQDCRSFMRRNLRGELTVLETRQRFALWKHQNRDVFKTLVRWLKSGDSSNTALAQPSLTNGTSRGMNEETDIMENTMYPLMVCASASIGDIAALKVVQEGMQDARRKHALQSNITDYTGSTPLHHAVAAGHVEMARHLLLLGASVHSRDRAGHSPLWNAAVRVRHAELVQLLRKTGAHFAEDESVNVQQELFNAVADEDVAYLELLQAAGADLTARSWDRRTLLHVAAARLDATIVVFLLSQRKLSSLRSAKDRWQHTAADEARLSMANAGVATSGLKDTQDWLRMLEDEAE
ncbi:hypothetical protein RI367_001458 [Sorochytrium milnesiophthora]